jgi:hypothetical protein
MSLRSCVSLIQATRVAERAAVERAIPVRHLRAYHSDWSKRAVASARRYTFLPVLHNPDAQRERV